MLNKSFKILLVVSLLICTLNLNASASVEDGVAKTTAVASGVVLGPVFSTTRGLVRGSIWGTNSVAAGLGNQDGVLQTIAGAFTGGIVGGLAGGLAGLMKGPYDAVRYGIDRPFSKENFSRAGNDFADYDPFDWTY